MVEDDRVRFSEVIHHFGVVSRTPVTAELKSAYWEDLRNMSLADFENAVTHLRRITKWLPKPSEFWAARRAGWT